MTDVFFFSPPIFSRSSERYLGAKVGINLVDTGVFGPKRSYGGRGHLHRISALKKRIKRFTTPYPQER